MPNKYSYFVSYHRTTSFGGWGFDCAEMHSSHKIESFDDIKFLTEELYKIAPPGTTSITILYYQYMREL